jgi:GNAT superfamily N-acetyltransferase
MTEECYATPVNCRHTPDEPGVRGLKAKAWRKISTCCAAWRRTGRTGKTALTRREKSCWGRFVNGQLVGVCGLNRDPFSQQPRAGRIRHLYISERHRRRGIGQQLLVSVITHSSIWFDFSTPMRRRGLVVL